MTHCRGILALAPLMATLSLGPALIGCARDEVPSAPPGVDTGHSATGDASAGVNVGLGGARLDVTTADPEQYYVGNHPDPWFFRSTITHAEFFDLIVKNTSGRAATHLELLVTVPGDLGPGGWMILIDDRFLSSIEDFTYANLDDSYYPRVPHFVYQPQGNARYFKVQGPETLAAGEEWVLPVQMSRGVSEQFKVHFVAASANGLWTSPLNDLTARPPFNNNGGGGERPGPGSPIGGPGRK